MAYNDSGELPVSQNIYSLGGYTFVLKVQNVHEPGEEEVVSVFVICHGPDGTRETQVLDFPAWAMVESWSIEANETEASVYVTIKSDEHSIIPSTQLDYFEDWWVGANHCRTEHRLSNTVLYATSEHRALCASSSPFEDHHKYVYIVSGEGTSPSRAYTKYGKTVHYMYHAYSNDVIAKPTTGATGDQLLDFDDAAWSMVYDIPVEDGDYLVGRFVIDLATAGGGPGGGWDEPGSVEPEPGELTHTLTLTAIAALSGRHNDPLNDTSYSYIPADNTAVKPYGCGGDGGHGGGGGGGASTMVIREIVTDKASHVDYVTRTKRHGYGSGGGKGGKGGDGCILIFY